MARESTEIRKQQIVQATMEIIVSEGLHNLTVQKIADSVGITDAAIYRHFASKQEILLTMIDSIRHNLFAHIGTKVADDQPARDQLQETLKRHLEFIEAEHGTPHILFSEALYTDVTKLQQRLRSIMEHYQDYITSIIRHGKERGEFREDLDEEAVPMLFLGVIQSNVMLWTLAGQSYSLTDNYDHLWKILSEGLR
ncbi:MAG: TetR/AcrR family transcriptional regulator [Candidatus Marinimicrobia bacterium]|nr:TetR/AcrR family transcriptional regulator [Candidatus Neomarinimicrobiota bacterium]MCF7829289.1 TetR/AcrR family transcriptional regulator [Candidatus Neomarinimicrobiota bacterium]MCF7880049.1 TetR/AcrR family transcriptional regulator [Candidatus Neomarinimicrobiota bacterium]